MTAAPPVAPLAALARRPAADPVLYWPGGVMSAGELRRRIASLAAAAAAHSPGPGPLRVTSTDRLEMLTGVLAGLSLGRPVLPLAAASGDDPAWGLPPGTKPAAELWVPTSGSSGPARIARLPAAALDAHVAASTAVLPRLGPGDRWLVCLPMHTIGALAAAWRALSAGASLALLKGFDAAAARALMAAGATHVSVVPAMLAPLAAAKAPPPRGLRCLLSGGGPLSQEAADIALAQGWPLWQGWGMTETCAHVAAGPVDAAWQPGVVGRPLPGAELSVEPGSGRIRIAGPMVMAGYLDPGGSRDAGLAADGSFLSSDAGEWLDDGRLRLLGRADEVIVSGGVNIHPETVEAALEACPGVDEAGVTSRPDPRWGALVVAVYAGDITPPALDEWARQHLPATVRPRRFLRVARLPRNAMGKLLRRQLGELGLEAEAGPLG
ncbi:class I adenylate-forming enzyme family protein [Thioalkalivibrio sp. XN279]|uniref:class I adenylate-forming enzyme family protein n=1 Tax=Thioalkalivibrio sp. XN279 TaxID=2714953 RepID=UPI00140CD7B0|nr:AMP-binding protein [Thioalkalivibrio sp. XN279]NHA15576.1 AMP-binding protein [Thioalkalivibrio sp. XN279]